MKKVTVLEQRQCKWDAREKRNTTMFMSAGVAQTAVLPNFIYGFFSHNMAGWVFPWMLGWWGVAMFGAVDSIYIKGPYPREPRSWEKKAAK